MSSHADHDEVARAVVPPWVSLPRWLQTNTFTPSWLIWPWSRQPAVGYLAATLLQVLATAMTLLLVRLFPTLAFRSALPVLIIVLVALTWGAGPSLLATLVGAVLLNYALLPPYFTWNLRSPSDGASLVLFIAVGLTLSRVVSASERRRRQAHAATQNLHALQQVTDTALSHLDMDTLLRQILAQVTSVLAVDNTAILLLDEAQQDLVVHLAHGPEEAVAGRVRVPLGQGIAGRIAASRRPLIVDDVRAADPVNPFLCEHIHALLGVPLTVNSRLLGVLHVGTQAAHHFTSQDMRFMQLVADRIAVALEHAHLYQAAHDARTQALEQAHQLRAIFEAVADGVFLFGRDGEVVQTNAAARAMFALMAPAATYAAPLHERGYQSVVHDERDGLLAEPQWPFRRVLQGEVLTGSSTVALQVQTPDGRLLDVDVSGAPVRGLDDQIAGAVCVVRNVTKRRQMERRTHDALNALLVMAQAMVRPVVPPTEGGVAPSQVGAVGQRLVALAREVLGCDRVGLVRFDLQTGVQHPVAVAGFSAAQEQAWWSSIEGAPIADPQAPSDPALVARFFAGEVVIVDMTQPPYRDQPNPFSIRTVLVAPLLLESAIVGLLSLDYGGTAHDYTADEMALAGAVAQLTALTLERERLHEEREQARATELALRETTQRMDEFLSIASHELKSPLTSIRGALQLARRRLQRARSQGLADDAADLAQGVEELLQRADGQVDRQARLINDLLDVSRIQRGHLDLQVAEHDLATLVRESVDEQRQAWPARRLTLDLPAEAVRVRIDADRIGQVLGNYISNALKYSAPDLSVEIALSVEADTALVRVRDHGVGLTGAQQEHLWDRYHRVEGVTVQDDTRAQGGGLGLGLYISRTIVEAHSGQVGVESAPGAGSAFWFTLPLTGSRQDGRG